jgi:hypothetical protein
LLEKKIRERRQSLEEFADFVETYARQHGEPGTLSLRHLQRLVSGRGAGGRALGTVRPATARLLEGIFGVSVDRLLAPPDEPDEAGQNGTAQFADGAGPIIQGNQFDAALDWLDRRSGWPAGTSRRLYLARVDDVRRSGLSGSSGRHTSAGRGQVARALSGYYRRLPDGYGLYRFCDRAAAGRNVVTSVVTRRDWVGLGCQLGGPESERLRLAPVERPQSERVLLEVVSKAAVERLAEMAVSGSPLVDAPLYRLLSVSPSPAAIVGEVSLAGFAEYALTVDLLERELVEALAAGRGAERGGALPLRAAYLPDVASVLDVADRLCVGGALALCAIARPRDPYRGGADYVLLVQERSGRVVNARGRLAVVPKGFHQPLTEPRADVRIGATLRRELEEELFGRMDADGTMGDRRAAAPMHPSRLSEPLRWLDEDPGRLRMECTAFGLNLVSGNYEFACLIVIEDEEFWARYGGAVQANWEAAGLCLYSSLDRELVGRLVHDPAWSNEGLFALVEGIRRLSEIGGRRVDLPDLAVTV